MACKSKNRKFTCFNQHDHKHSDEYSSASIVSRTNGRFWICFSCGAKGDILNAVQYKEGIKGFNNQIRFLSEKYSTKIQRECETTTATHNNSQWKENKNNINKKDNNNFNDIGKEVDLKSSPKNNTPKYHKKITANYYYEDENGKGLYKICRREWMEEGETKKDFMA